LRDAKELLREAYAVTDRPEWFSQLEITPDRKKGFLPFDEAFEQWLISDKPPHSLGRFFAVSAAIKQLAELRNERGMVAFSSGQLESRSLANWYLAPFTAEFSERLDLDLSSRVSPEETYLGWRAGMWDFETPSIKAYFNCMMAFAQTFPNGFTGLDRDQVIRRFSQGMAGFVVANGGDAAAIINGAAQIEDDDLRFEVGIMEIPVPLPDERWGEFAVVGRAESGFGWATSVSVNRSSPNRDIALDFLRYWTSVPVNEKFCRLAGWMPMVERAVPPERMQPFLTDNDGVGSAAMINLTATGGTIMDTYTGNIWLYAQGEISYQVFTERMTEALNNVDHGVDRSLFDNRTRKQDNYLAKERVLMARDFQLLVNEADAAAEENYNALLLDSARENNATVQETLWNTIFPGEPYPQF
jgi:hypothetical protein